MSDYVLDEDSIQINLPSEILYKIFLYTTYDDISKLRLVCKQFNSLASFLLNSGFSKVQTLHSQSLKQIKDGLPRRESERRKHALYPRHEALQGLDTRISLLRMTYNKYIWSNMCCFIPGKVLDEIFSVLDKINASSHLPSTEVRDISSMAMEHFDDVIAPLFAHALSEFPEVGSPHSSQFSSSPLSKALKLPLSNSDTWSGSIMNLSSAFSSPSPNSPSKFCKVQVHKLLRIQKANKRKFKKMIIGQRKETRSLKMKMARSNKHVMLLRSIIRKQKKCVEEVKLQIMELTTQLHSLQGILALKESPGMSLSVASHKADHIGVNAEVSIASRLQEHNERVKRKHADTVSAIDDGTNSDCDQRVKVFKLHS